MQSFSRSRFMWISATIASGLLYFFAFHFFPKTFPLIHLDIDMNLSQALEQAELIAKKNNFGPINYSNAAVFHTDEAVKTFVELDAGGKDALVRMMEEKLYMPYTWRVRHFKENEKNETTIRFMPDGTPYGFVSVLSEDLPGAELPEAEARTIAEKIVTQNWDINLADYALVEASIKTQPSKRIDHRFVYERTDKKIGEGAYRLKIVVSGDTVTEITPFVKVPESFTRRYAEIRSANHTISWAANFLMMLLYLIGGCCLGLYWITKKRWLIFKQPMIWALFLSLVSILTAINQLPVFWMGYNTVTAKNIFIMLLFTGFIFQFLWQLFYIALIIMTAESLTRRAFAKHPQLWLSWSPENAASYAIFDRTFGSYLMVGFNCAFVIAFYLFSTQYLNWWTPSETLFDPNILATYVPWFSSLAKSINAGFIEECLYRAIPLAGAALLGSHFGKRNLFIGIALILQALIFGAAHAHYATQPSYARLIELFVPSLMWGLLYLRVGLFFNILIHTVYDIIWLSLPIFASHAPQSLIYKIIIITITLSPLLYCIYARIKKGYWTYLESSERNGSWQPPVTHEIAIEQPITVVELNEFPQQRKNLFFCLGIMSLIVWLWTTPFKHDGLPIELNRSQAINQAHTYLQQKNVVLPDSWKTLPLMFSNYNLVAQIKSQHAFVWREGGKELYHSLLGTYLQPAHWTIRYAQFDSNIIDRAEEYKVMLFNKHDIWQYYHQLPENSVGDQLNQEQARAIAHATLQQQFGLEPNDVVEISAEQSQLPHRRNWLFVFSNPSVFPLGKGQARISIVIAGNKVINAIRTIHVPEEWERTEQNKQHTVNLISLILLLMRYILIIFGLFLAFRHNKKTVHINKQFFCIVFIVLILISLIHCINSWPMVVAAFNTSAPFTNQVFQSITALIFSSFVKAILLALAIAFVTTAQRAPHLSASTTVILGVCAGSIFAAIMSIAQKLVPNHLPLWPLYDTLAEYSSLSAAIITTITYYIQLTIAAFLSFLIIDKATEGWTKYRILFCIIASLCGTSIVTLSFMEQLPVWISIGIITGLVTLVLYYYVVRYNYAMIPLITGTFALHHIIQQGIFNAYPLARIEAIVGIVIIGALSTMWHRYLNKQHL